MGQPQGPYTSLMVAHCMPLVFVGDNYWVMINYSTLVVYSVSLSMCEAMRFCFMYVFLAVMLMASRFNSYQSIILFTCVVFGLVYNLACSTLFGHAIRCCLVSNFTTPCLVVNHTCYRIDKWDTDTLVEFLSERLSS